ncbi:YgaP-like transmembrane domain [Fodinicurvata halophila]|uniref:YgaP-like transmembrane domain n=1 Tax=Fodinicurvata halophila TaxID=1419723 RepID=A0ABV8UNR2_9PROT
MSLERMILLIVGLVVVASVLLAVYVNLNWLWLTGLMGAHLIQAAFTGLCPVVALLKRLRMPQRPGFG